MHKDFVFRNNSYNETFEDSNKINFAMFMCVALSHPPPTSVLTKRIIQRHNGVGDLSSPTTYNIDWSYFCFVFVHYSLQVM